MQKKTSRAASKKLRTGPDSAGRFGPYGGRFVPETLMAPLDELARAYDGRAATDVSATRSTSCCGTTSAVRRRSPSPSG